MGTASSGEWIAILLYFALVIGVGVYFFIRDRHVEGEKEYFLGGRSMGGWVAALSAGASDMSAWVLMGLPGSIYLYGIGKVWIAVGLVIGTICAWVFVAPRLRRYSIRANDSITIPQFLTNRFQSKNKGLQIISAIVFVVVYCVYSASSISACGTLFNTVTGMSAKTAMIIATAIILVYVFLGGFNAVCWTDFFQGMLMLAALMLTPILALFVMKGADFVAPVMAVPENYYNVLSGGGFNWKSMSDIISGLGWGLGYFGMPHILVRFMSIDNPAEVKGSRRIAMTWVFISLGAATVLGLVFHLYLKQRGLTLADVGNDPEKCFMVMINGIFNTGVLARVFAGILLSAIMAAIMSTADSQLLVSASSFTNDLYGRVKKRASNRELVLVSRLAVAAVAIVAAALAMNTESDFFKVVMKMVSFAWAGFGASFGPLILLALFWRRVNLAGAVSGMIVGAATCFIWKFVLAAKYATAHPIFNLYELAPGFLLALVVTVVVSLVTKAPAAEIVAEYEKVDAE